MDLNNSWCSSGDFVKDIRMTCIRSFKANPFLMAVVCFHSNTVTVNSPPDDYKVHT